MKLTEEDRISLIKSEAIRQKQNKLQSNYSKSKAKLRQERIEQVNLLMKSGIHEEDAFDIARAIPPLNPVRPIAKLEISSPPALATPLAASVTPITARIPSKVPKATYRLILKYSSINSRMFISYFSPIYDLFEICFHKIRCLYFYINKLF